MLYDLYIVNTISKSLNKKFNNYNIYKLLKIIESFFIQIMDWEKNISFILGTDLLCNKPFNTNLLVLQSLWRFTHIRKNIIIYNKDRRHLTALQSTSNRILVLITCISIEITSNNLNQLQSRMFIHIIF